MLHSSIQIYKTAQSAVKILKQLFHDPQIPCFVQEHVFLYFSDDPCRLLKVDHSHSYYFFVIFFNCAKLCDPPLPTKRPPQNTHRISSLSLLLFIDRTDLIVGSKWQAAPSLSITMDIQTKINPAGFNQPDPIGRATTRGRKKEGNSWILHGKCHCGVSD